MHEVDVAILVRGEGEDEGVGETFVMLFRADVHARFECDDAGNFRLQRAKIFFHRGDLLLGGGLLELEKDRVDEPAALSDDLGGRDAEREQKQNTGDDDNIFHGPNLAKFPGTMQAKRRNGSGAAVPAVSPGVSPATSFPWRRRLPRHGITAAPASVRNAAAATTARRRPGSPAPGPPTSRGNAPGWDRSRS